MPALSANFPEAQESSAAPEYTNPKCVPSSPSVQAVSFHAENRVGNSSDEKSARSPLARQYEENTSSGLDAMQAPTNDKELSFYRPCGFFASYGQRFGL